MMINKELIVCEYCPHCDNEVAVVWTVSADGHSSLFCPHCGERIMLCSECPVRDGEANCDWGACTDKSKEPICFWDNAFGSKQQSFEYNGYTIVQEQLVENFHYSIFDEDGQFCMHAACTKKIESQEKHRS